MFASKIDSNFVESYRNMSPPWGPIGHVTYKRTYARKLFADAANTEEFWQTLQRCCNGLLEIGAAYSQEEIQSLYHYLFNFKGSLAGRALWQLGTDTVRKVGADSLINCWLVANDEPIEPFTFAFDELMLGGGVGFSVLPEYVYQLPEIKHIPQLIRSTSFDCDFIVPDNRGGWVELLRRMLTSFFFKGARVEYCTGCVRSKGTPIKSFGGVASGPEDLVIGLQQIHKIMSDRYQKKLRPIDVVDINNILGKIVVAGNVRRSAELMLGDSRDSEYMDAKNWKKTTIPPWRSMSNNSVWADDFDNVPSSFWDGYNGDGEPYGLVNLRNHQRFGRISDGLDYRPDIGVRGVNPCSEISLEPYECCNLAEIYLPNLTDADEFVKVAKLLYMAQKAISCMKYSHPRTQEVVSRNHRLGLGITGYLQSDFYEDHSAFTSVYKTLEEFDRYYSSVLGTKPSIKLTTVKPSGTLSLLPGVTPGGHPGFSPFYIRRIRFASNDPIVEACRNNGYSMEPQLESDGKYNMDTMVIDFPVKLPYEAICTKDVTAINQLDNLKFLQTYWADNSVSVTIYYKLEELPAIKNWLSDHYNDSIKSVSFLLHSGHGFKQAPYEEITADSYYSMLEKLQPLTFSDKGNFEMSSVECEGGQCPVR